MVMKMVDLWEEHLVCVLCDFQGSSYICIGVLLAFQKFMAIIKAMLSLNMMTAGRIRKVPPIVLLPNSLIVENKLLM